MACALLLVAVGASTGFPGAAPGDGGPPLGGAGPRPGRCVFEGSFAPEEGLVKPVERPFRAEICLNGLWQFQPAAVPPAFRGGEGEAPELPLPDPRSWDGTPIKIPSPWNVNRWGPGRRGRDVGEGTPRPYQPDSEYYPSYPPSWDDARMGWLRRTFRVPPGWGELRIILHFEAVAGEFRALVNGQEAGRHFDSHLPAEFDVTKLVRRDAENELLVGVRHRSLFDRRSETHPRFSATYPPGSNTDRLAGIWQDVFLLGVPALRVEDAFVQPGVAAGRLVVSATLRNDTALAGEVELRGVVRPWSSLAGADTLSAPEPRWALGETAVEFPSRLVRLEPGATAVVDLTVEPRGRLATWSPSAPNLYGLVLSLRRGEKVLDTRYERFGWRELSIHGRQVRLNGEPLRMFGDFCHPFGPFMMTRRFAWAWCRMIQDFGGNALRPHAQPYPRFYLDVADEMGVLVLDETAAFGSSARIHPGAPEFWTRFAAHYEGLIRRDRNHPCVFGWSFGNEMFAIPLLNGMSPAETADYQARLAEIGLRGRQWDPSRVWISCDGDEDLGGALPVWSKHYGHGLAALPPSDRPQMVGESGGTYYATPRQLAAFNGDRAYEGYLGRNEALAIDLYKNITEVALPKLAYFSPSELVWFGLEHLPLGRREFVRPPTLEEGAFFGAFVEGRPGMQPERLPPYCGTLNPGWDPALPAYRPLPMFHAMRAALAEGGPRPCPWDHRREDPRSGASPVPSRSRRPSIEGAALLGDRGGLLGRRLAALGVPLSDEAGRAGGTTLVIVDADGLAGSALRGAIETLRGALSEGGIGLVCAGRGEARPGDLGALLGAPARTTDRIATALVPDPGHPWTASFRLRDLDFAEDGGASRIASHGAEGAFVERGRVLLRASETDWSLFNGEPEDAKAGSLVLYEQLIKPAGAVLVEGDRGEGKLALLTLDPRVESRAADRLWRTLLTNMGVVLRAPLESVPPALDEDGTLVRALAIGRFGAPGLEGALGTEFLGEGAPDGAAGRSTAPGDASRLPRRGATAGERSWKEVSSPSRDRFILRELDEEGPRRAFAVYFSYWIKSPRSVDDILEGGPGAPRLSAFCYASAKCRLFLDGRELSPARTEPADYRTLYVFEGLPLAKGWNHILLKVAADRLDGAEPGTLAVRIRSSDPDYFRLLESAIELPASEGRRP